MSELEPLGVIIGAIIFIFGILLALSPLLCWLNLRAIRKQQEVDSDMLDEHLSELRETVENIEFTLGRIQGVLEKQA